MKPGVWSWECQIYHARFALLVCEPEAIQAGLREALPDNVADHLWAECYRRGLDDCNGRYAGTVRFGRHMATIWLRPETASVPILAHEALHAVWDVLGRKGLYLSNESEEAFTYYLEWMLREAERRMFPEAA